jgi:hypothetical protein
MMMDVADQKPIFFASEVVVGIRKRKITNSGLIREIKSPALRQAQDRTQSHSFSGFNPNPEISGYPPAGYNPVLPGRINR